MVNRWRRQDQIQAPVFTRGLVRVFPFLNLSCNHGENPKRKGAWFPELWKRHLSQHRFSSPDIYLSSMALGDSRFFWSSLVTPVFLKPCHMRGCWNMRDLVWTYSLYCQVFSSPGYLRIRRDLGIIFEISTRAGHSAFGPCIIWSCLWRL